MQLNSVQSLLYDVTRKGATNNFPWWALIIILVLAAIAITLQVLIIIEDIKAADRELSEEVSFKDRVSHIFKRTFRALQNQTFLYIVRRVLSALLTIFLLIALVTALIRLIPDTKFYDAKAYKTLLGKNPTVAENWKNHQLFLCGRSDQNGNPRSVLFTIFQYIYWILPIPKEIPQAWTDWTCTEVLRSWKGLSYFGNSLLYRQYVMDLLTERMGISIVISLISTFGCYILAIPLGVAMAKKPGGIVDKIGNVFIVLNYAIPGIVFYLVMNIVFGDPHGIFGWAKFNYYYIEGKPMTLFPPLACIIFLGIPGVSIWVRRYMVDELSKDYVKFARSKGLSERRIMYTHVLRNACVPLVRNIPAIFIGSIVGSYYIENIWRIHGTGELLINALQGAQPDIQLIQGLTIIYAGLSMLSFLLGDIVTVFFDPRIKLMAD